MGFAAPLAMPLLSGAASAIGGALIGKAIGKKASGAAPAAAAPAQSLLAPSAPRAPQLMNSGGATAFFPSAQNSQGGTFLTQKSGAANTGTKKTLLGQ